MTTVTANHMKARNIEDIQDIGATRTVAFVADVNLSGLPAPMQSIAHNPGNTLAVRRHADFTLDNGAWKLQSVQ
jgi:hypothetical protein